MKINKIISPPKPRPGVALTVQQREFCSELALVMDKAHRLGLYKTGHLLHEAVRQVGWEVAEHLNRK